jgi:hypothetical protein
MPKKVSEEGPPSAPEPDKPRIRMRRSGQMVPVGIETLTMDEVWKTVAAAPLIDPKISERERVPINDVRIGLFLINKNAEEHCLAEERAEASRRNIGKNSNRATISVVDDLAIDEDIAIAAIAQSVLDQMSKISSRERIYRAALDQARDDIDSFLTQIKNKSSKRLESVRIKAMKLFKSRKKDPGQVGTDRVSQSVNASLDDVVFLDLLDDAVFLDLE